MVNGTGFLTHNRLIVNACALSNSRLRLCDSVRDKIGHQVENQHPADTIPFPTMSGDDTADLDTVAIATVVACEEHS